MNTKAEEVKWTVVDLLESLARSVVPPAYWGRPMVNASLQHHRYEHVVCGFFCVPEGVLVVSRCRECGGRDESIIRVTPEEIANTVDVIKGEWADEHSECAKSPRRYALPAVLQNAVTSATETIREHVRDGKPFAQHVIYMAARRQDGTCEEMVMPLSAPTNPIATQLQFAALRSMLQESGLDPIGACSIGVATLAADVWEGAQVGSTVLGITVTTPSFGFATWAPIKLPTEGEPGSVGELAEWRPLCWWEAMIDGLVAVPPSQAQR